MRFLYLVPLLFITFLNIARSQVIINEGSNRNYSLLPDENGEFPDWIELYNIGNQSVNLNNYSLTDDADEPAKWTFPNVTIDAHGYLTIFCSGKDRRPIAGFVNVRTINNFTPIPGWNTHNFTTPFYWDGVSNILINTCSYSSTGYTSNSVFKQTATSYNSTSYYILDGSNGACSFGYGTTATQRPNIKLNGHAVGTGQLQNSPDSYPAPYGNWYWSSRHQMLIKAEELIAAGISEGYITSLGFDVVSTDPNTVYDYFEIHMKPVTESELSGEFIPVDVNNYLHTNFKISQNGESVYLFSPSQNLLSDLFVDCGDLDNSRGSYPDGSFNTYLFATGTPSATNNTSQTYNEYLQPPVLSVTSGIYEEPFTVSVINPNQGLSPVHYTMDGSEPSIQSPLYTEPLQILYPCVFKARAFSLSKLPSRNSVASYLFNVNHTTPVLSVITDPVNLYGATGIFDNWWTDWEKSAYMDYFDENKTLIASQRSGIQMDGGWGGSRYLPQHSFRLEPGDGVLGDGAIEFPMIPGRSERNKYSKLYLRNGSNQYLVLPYKEGCQVESMGAPTFNYYSAMTPVSVYINGYYYGLYELREKVDAEYFDIYDDADTDSIDLLSLSAWYGYVLRAIEGSTTGFLDDYGSFINLNTADTGYWNNASKYFDLKWYTDYIIGESFMANTDWPQNNIKLYRSDKTGFSWRFLINDPELGLAPNGWTDCYFDHIAYMLQQDPNNKFINIWLRSIQNQKYRNYFINRFADLLNSAYLTDSLLAVENKFFESFITEMPNEYARWGDVNTIPEQMNGFINNHNIFVSQLQLRSSEVRNHLLNNFDLRDQLNVSLDVYPSSSGKIHISTISPNAYPWQGIYFSTVPIQIEAIPEPGYSFLYWEDNGRIPDTTNPVFIGTLGSEDITFTAHFDPTSINTNDETPPVTSIYPNPATNVIFIKGGTGQIESDYMIDDASGRIITQGKLLKANSLSEIDISKLNKGFYNLKIRGKSGYTSHWFVKM